MIKVHTPLEKGLGDWIEDSTPSSFGAADIVLLPGGSDVDPALYKHGRLNGTFVDKKSDDEEMALLNKAIDAGKFIIGICKGSQMLTVRAGGWLIQDVDNHQSYHEIETYNGETFLVNSSHHQMSYPYDLSYADYQLVGWSNMVATRFLTQGYVEVSMSANEPEIIWYPKLRGLAVQMHPEWKSSPIKFNKWLNKTVLHFLKVSG